MKKLIGALSIFVLLFALTGQAFALDRATAVSSYSAELVALGMTKEEADKKAEADVATVVGSMQESQTACSYGFDSIKNRVDQLLSNDKRKDAAEAALDKAAASKDAFVDMDPESNLFVQKSLGGAPPLVVAGDDFRLAHQTAEEDQNAINRVLISPTPQGAVPAGDIVSDFLPQIIRQLFRFAWLAILVALTVSGVMLVMAHDDDEKLTKAKSMIYYSLIGFAFIVMAFALVKAVTDIDFFNFV